MMSYIYIYVHQMCKVWCPGWPYHFLQATWMLGECGARRRWIRRTLLNDWSLKKGQICTYFRFMNFDNFSLLISIMFHHISGSWIRITFLSWFQTVFFYVPSCQLTWTSAWNHQWRTHRRIDISSVSSAPQVQSTQWSHSWQCGSGNQKDLGKE